jgi:hypothetical protein
LRDSIVLMHRPQTEFLRNDRQQPSEGNGPVQTGNPPLPGPSSATSTSAMLTRLRAFGAGAALSPGAMEHGTVLVQGSRARMRGYRTRLSSSALIWIHGMRRLELPITRTAQRQ